MIKYKSIERKMSKMKKNIISLAMLGILNISASSYLLTLDDKHYKNSIVEKEVQNNNPETPETPEGQGIVGNFDFKNQAVKNEYAYNPVSDQYLLMDNASTVWGVAVDGEEGVKSIANIPNPFGDAVNYTIEVVAIKEGHLGTGTGQGAPRLVSIDGTKYSSLGWYRDGCASDAFVVRYYDSTSTARRPEGNVANWCDNWMDDQNNSIVYQKSNETLTVTLNGVLIGQYTDLHPTLNNISSSTLFISNVNGNSYTNKDTFIKSFKVTFN